MLATKLADHGMTDRAAEPPPAMELAEFDDRAHEVLQRLRPVVRDEVLRELPRMHGTWHPTGFMVFRLGHHERLGSLRLHIWPAGLRRREPKGRGHLGAIHDGDIHDHAWGVASTVLAEYEDTIYDVAPVAQADGWLPPSQFLVFTVAYGARAHNTLVTDGSCVEAVPRTHRRIAAGDFHAIAPGEYHAPTVPDDALCATLVYSGPRMLEHGPHVLVGGSTEPIVGHRLEVTEADATIAAGQLQDAL